MNLFSMMDQLLRDRESLYQTAAEGKDLKGLSGRLLLIFVITAAIYGLGMGSFRWIHPDYFFSNFELTGPAKETTTGSIAGINSETKKVYVKGVKLPDAPEGQVRFNLSLPSDDYKVVSITHERDYGVIELAPESVLQEANPWRIPLLAAAKIPCLFVLTLTACLLALYVLNLAFGVGLRFMPTIAVMAFGLSATGIMLGVFVPIVALFSVVTESYHFMIVLHVVIFAIAGAFGLKVLYQGLTRLAPQGAGGIKKLLLSWLLLYCLVGGQVAWSLKPYLGTPYLPATPPFRVEKGNIYVSFFRSLSEVGR